LLEAPQCRSCPMNQLRAQVSIAALADAEEFGFAPGAVLARYKTKPGREVAPSGEGACIADGRNQCSCVDRADARYGHQSMCCFVATETFCQFVVQVSNSAFYLVVLGAKIADQLLHPVAQGILIGGHSIEVTHQRLAALGKGQPALQKDRAQLIG